MKDKLGRFIKGIPSWNKGIPASEETKRKISIAHLGKKGYWKGKKLSKEHREKLSISHKGKRNPPGCGFQKGHIPVAPFKKGHKSVFKGKKRPNITGKNNSRWKGRIKDKHGYIFINISDHPFRDGNGYVREQRLVIEKQIGRYLLPEEKIHHLNEVKDDNRPENLMAFTSESAHQRFHHNPYNVKPEEIIFDGRRF